MLTIQNVISQSTELNIVQNLFAEYAAELNENLCFQSFDTELADPLKKYGPPAGSILLAYYNGQPAGCVALQPLPDKSCEMKRLFTRPNFRGIGVGEFLVAAIVANAKELGYATMVLDTLQRLQPAIKLYEKFGFTNTSAYYKNPLPNVVYMQKQL